MELLLWRHALPSEEPQDKDDILIVVPNSLQMGWTESPPCFCAGTETARDLTKINLPTVADLDVHPLEHKIEPLHAELNSTDRSAAEDDMSISDGDDDELKLPSLS